MTYSTFVYLLEYEGLRRAPQVYPQVLERSKGLSFRQDRLNIWIAIKVATEAAVLQRCRVKRDFCNQPGLDNGVHPVSAWL